MNDGRLSALAYCATLFAGSFLLFQLEPMMGKFILPWFGGAQAVWTTCILFFQIVLVAGYAYAHLIGTRLGPRRQALVHLALVALCLMSMGALALIWQSPIMPPAAWKPPDPALPVLRIVKLLLASVGLPYFVLSTTAPLLQAWFAQSCPGSSPYRLYAFSNLGAMLGLLLYPFVVEPAFRLSTQARLWLLMYIAFASGIVWCARTLPVSAAHQPPYADPHDYEESGPAPAAYLLWLGLSAFPSLLFLAVTNELCQDVAAVPFLWVVPLAIYLLSLSLCFGSERCYPRGLFNLAFALTTVLVCAVLYRPAIAMSWQIVVYLALLICACMVCHGELVRLKPGLTRLTSFYLTVSAGGALGGLFGAVLAPWIFRGFWELQLSIFGCAAALYGALLYDGRSWMKQRGPLLALALLAGVVLSPELILPGAAGGSLLYYNLAVGATLIAAASAAMRGNGSSSRGHGLLAVTAGSGLLLIGAILLYNVRARLAVSLVAGRNFYGSYAVVLSNAGDPAWRSYTLRHGRIRHGMQFPQPDKRYRPTSYYGPTSGIGLLLLHDRVRALHPLHIGIVGLGAGTVAAYGRPGDYIRFYEIDPAIIKLATATSSYFTYVRDSQARVEIVPGDARLSMEREIAHKRGQHFDVLAIDAFSGDSIPVHLLTSEAFAIYLRLLAPDGVLAFHISNRYVDLKPVLLQSARHFGLRGGWVHDEPSDRLSETSDWVLLARNDLVLGQSGISQRLTPLSGAKPVRMWTDDYSNLFQILR